MPSGSNNVRYAFRVLRKDFGFTLTAVLMLGTGHRRRDHHLQPREHRSPRIFELPGTRPAGAGPRANPASDSGVVTCTCADILEFQKISQAFEGAAGWVANRRDISSDGGQPTRVVRMA